MANTNKQNQARGKRTGSKKQPLKFIPLSVYRGKETSEAYSLLKANIENVRRTSEQVKRKLLRASIEQAKKHYSDKDIKDYWLKQIDKAASLPIKDWAKSKIKWPKDKPLVYAITAICMQAFSRFEILPESFEKTEQYKINEKIYVRYVGSYTDFSLPELLSYIEADLKEEGLLKIQAQDEGITKKPKKKKSRSRLSKTEQKKRLDILKRYEKNNGKISRKEFCMKEKITVNDLKIYQDWRRKQTTKK